MKGAKMLTSNHQIVTKTELIKKLNLTKITKIDIWDIETPADRSHVLRQLDRLLGKHPVSIVLLKT